MVGLLGRVISLYLHRTTQHRKTRDKHPCLNRDLNPRSSVWAIKTRASDRAATGSSCVYNYRDTVRLAELIAHLSQENFHWGEGIQFNQVTRVSISKDCKYCSSVGTHIFYSLYLIDAGHSGRAVWGVGLSRLVAGIVGSNPAQGMDVCQRLSVLCCLV
jgi:hypothetical protein